MGRVVRCVVVLVVCCVVSGAFAAAVVADQGATLTDSARAVVAGEVARSGAGAVDSAVARGVRERSRSAFRGLSPSEAGDALVAEQSSVVSRPGWLLAPSLSPFSAAKPLGPNMLSVDGGSRPDSVVLTSQPVAFRDRAGDLQKIDLGLREHAGDLVPDSSPLGLSLPGSLSEGISVGQGDRRFTIDPEFSGGAAASVEQYAAFYGDVAQDTDFVAKPVLGGVETFAVLRSPASPEQLRLRLGGAPDTAVRAASPDTGGGFVLSSGDRDLAAISPPQAWDAQHRPVTVETTVDGNELVLRVDHRDQDVAYPIVVDPTVVDTCWAWVDLSSGCQVDAWETDRTGTYNGGTVGWTYESATGGRFAPYAGPGYLGTGLYIRNTANNYFWSGEAGDWYYRAPSGVRIWSAQFSNLSQDNLGDNMSCLFVGVLENNGVWGRSSPRTFCAQQSLDQSFMWCPGTSCADQSGGTPGNAAIFGAMAQHTGWSSYWMDDMGGAAIALTETSSPSNNPYISSPDFPDTWQTDPNRVITFHVSDAGLGIRRIDFSSPENPSWQAIDADTGAAASRQYACTGGARLACPMDVWIRMKLGQLRQGYSTIRVKVTDIVGKTYTYEHAIAIQYYWTATQYGGTNGIIDTESEVTNVVNAMAAASPTGRQALWAGLDQTSRDYYINNLLPDAKVNRQSYGFDASDATTRSVFNDPTTQGTIATYGAPMTSAEWANFSDDSPPSWAYDGPPNPDVLASTYNVSTDDGANVPDSTGNRGCDPATESGCPDSATTSTYALTTPSDPVTDDLNAVAGTASSEDAVNAGAASSRFDRYRARADADAHAMSPRTGLFEPFGDSDCTNFVSQVWNLGGGLPMKTGWRIRWKKGGGLGSRDPTNSWTLVRSFVYYMVNQRQTSRLINADVTSYNLPSQAAIADAIEYDWGRGEGWSHLAVVVKTNSNIDYVSQHSTNRRESLWDLGWYNEQVRSVRDNMRARLVHLRAP
jgi:hypothetical protein